MILFFGPAGAGKSVQGQFLAARQGWRWLSAGQLLRDTRDGEVLKSQHEGKLVDSEKVNQIIAEALNRASNIDKVILDGYPRKLEQAKWLVDSRPQHSRSIGLIVVLEVPRDELMKRLELRGRIDDTPEVIDDRLRIYRHEIYPILDYFTEQGINIAHIDGSGTPGQVHDKVMKELVARKLA